MRRKIYKMICVAVACMSLTACDSWLDVDPSDQYSTETFWKTKEHASAGIMGCYNALKPWRSLHTMEFDMLTANAMPYNEHTYLRGRLHRLRGWCHANYRFQ